MKQQRIRAMSDIHNEFGILELQPLPSDANTILVLAGDIGIATKPATFMPFIEKCAEQFQDVIYVLGNHEHYHGSINRSADKLQKAIDRFGNITNVHVANNEVIKINDISFVCSTMWASYSKQDPLCMYDAKSWMSDHRVIRCGPRGNPYIAKFSPQDAYMEFIDAINFIFPAITEEKKKGQKVCVVTHHAPSLQSIAPEYTTGTFATLNGAYASDLDQDIIEAGPDLWIHGHTHVSFDYNINNTRIVCNPRGYVGQEENPEFDQRLLISMA